MRIGATLLTLLALTGSARADEKGPRPNILFILTDDQRWDSLGVDGNKVFGTPHLDRLAAQGARLDAFYVAAPLCNPSRASLLTGLYPHRHGGLGGGAHRPVQVAEDIPAGTETVANVLNSADYRTGFIGKAHLGGDPRRWGFSETPVFLGEGSSDHVDPRLNVGSHVRKGAGPHQADLRGRRNRLHSTGHASAVVPLARDHSSAHSLLRRGPLLPPFGDHAVTGLAPGRGPVDTLAIYPTLSDLCGLPRPGRVEGESIRALLADPRADRPPPALKTYLYKNHALRNERGRYIRYADGSEELSDHERDPLEWTNLAADARFDPVKAELRRWLPARDAPPGPANDRPDDDRDEE